LRKYRINEVDEILIDDTDYNKIIMYDWKLTKASKEHPHQYVYASMKDLENKTKKLYLQHLLFGEAPDGKVIWFKDGNRLNFQKSNIEFISNSEKGHLVHHVNLDSAKKYRGVTACYMARIRENGKLRTIGMYKSAAEAAEAYNAEVKKLYGEFAKII
jgi:HNH endonuclease